MKTKLHTAALITMITLFTANLFASEFNFEEESYIDDIPFNTEMVVNEMMTPEFEEEAYINDIPFNTASIAASYDYNTALSVLFEMEEEAYIDDMHFNTAIVTGIYTYNNAISVEFQLNDESYIDDIPFNTYLIACNNNVDTNLYTSR